MASQILPASPSWYCSRVLDCNERGVMCFGAKNTIYIFDVTDRHATFNGQIAAHNDRIVGLSLSPSKNVSSCVSASEDGKIKVWDIQDRSLISEHSQHQSKPTTVHWSPCDERIIVSGDEKGRIVVFNPKTLEHKLMQFEHTHIFSLTCSPHDTDLVAIGYKSGIIVVSNINVKGGTVVQRLRGHDEEIHSLVWCPVRGEAQPWITGESGSADDDNWREQSQVSGLIASGCKDRTIRVWALSRGKSVSVLKLPYNTGHRRDRFDEAKTRVWLALCWPTNKPDELISSSFNGDLLSWDLGKQGKQKWQMFSQGLAARAHQRIIFSICAGGSNLNTLITTSMDRQINMWHLDTLSGSHCMTTLGGFAYAIAISPIHPGRMAIGCGDNLLRLWNFENPNDPYEVQTFWQGIKSKVTCLCWHPEKEGLLAYGTDDGRVGLYDVLSNKSPVISSTYHKRTVYVVNWGPQCVKNGVDISKQMYNIYSCGDGVILQHFANKLDGNAMNINKIIQDTNSIKSSASRSEISWKSDFTVVAIGNDDGSIEVFRAPHLRLVCVIQQHKKLVNCIVWHPAHTADSSGESKCSAWIASGSNEPVIHVTDLQQALKQADGDKPMVVTESFRRLEGHTNRITGLSWNLHKEGWLASACYDSTAQIWDVKVNHPVANFRGHRGKLLCVEWCHLEDGVVYTGSDDHSVQRWLINQQPHKVPPTGTGKKRVRKGKKTSSANDEKSGGNLSEATDIAESSHPREVTKSGPSVDELQKLLSLKKQEIQLNLQSKSAPDIVLTTNASESESLIQSSLNDVEEVQEVDELNTKRNVFRLNRPEPKTASKDDRKERKKKKWKSLFPLSSSLDNRGKIATQHDCVSLSKLVNSSTGEPTPTLEKDSWHLGGYLDRKSMYEFHEAEVENHTASGNWEQLVTLATFRGSPRELILQAKEAGTLNDWLLALAPSVSMTFWREMCLNYAQQLERDGSLQKSAAYYISAQKIYEAIDMLKNNNMFKEALGLAKVRLSTHDPVINDLYQAWGHQLTRDGNLEMAAKCFIALKDPIEAANVLTKRSDQTALSAAIQVLVNAGETETAKMYVQKQIYRCLQNCDWPTAEETVQLSPSFRGYSLLVSTHHTLVKQLFNLGLLEKEITEESISIYDQDTKLGEQDIPYILLENKPEVCVPWPPHIIDGEAFVHHLLRVWYTKWEISLELSQITSLYQQLYIIKQAHQAQTDMRQVLIGVSLDVALGLLKFILSDTESAAESWVFAVSMAHETGHSELSQGLLRLLLPTGPRELPKLQQQTRATRILLTKAAPKSLSRNERNVSSIDLTSLGNVGHEPGSINTISETFTHVDAMAAYYWLNVLQNLESINKSDCETGRSSDSGFSSFSFEEMCQCLLWDIQAKRFKLTETLLYINKATGQLISSHKSDGAKITLKVTPPKQESIDRPGSGEYMVMHGSDPKEFPLVVKSGGKPHQRIPLSPIQQACIVEDKTTEAFVEMGPPSAECTPLCETAVSGTTDIDTHSVPIAEAPARLHSVVELDNASVKRENSIDMEVAFLTESVNRTGANVAEKGESSYQMLTTEWEDMPINKRFLHPDMSLLSLSQERDKVNKELQDLPDIVKVCPFPNPVDAAIQLREVFPKFEKDTDVVNQVLLSSWITKFGYKENHK